jgi:hypothetical protein
MQMLLWQAQLKGHNKHRQQQQQRAVQPLWKHRQLRRGWQQQQQVRQQQHIQLQSTQRLLLQNTP